MNTQFNRAHPARNLPDAYSKGRESNNAKILEIEKSTLDLLREEIFVLYEALDLDNAKGATLDLYGEMVGQERGVATDEQYLMLIKNRIIRNFANADHNSIVNAICMTFGGDPSEVILTEHEDPCKVTLEGLPLSKINESNLDVNTAVQIVNGLMPAGVFMEAMEFSGTFEFSGEELVYDEQAGFADEAETIGGYWGLLSDGSGSNLPV